MRISEEYLVLIFGSFSLVGAGVLRERIAESMGKVKGKLVDSGEIWGRKFAFERDFSLTFWLNRIY
jgi:hypothetical protein